MVERGLGGCRTGIGPGGWYTGSLVDEFYRPLGYWLRSLAMGTCETGETRKSGLLGDEVYRPLGPVGLWGDQDTGDFVIQSTWCANVNGTLTDGTPYSSRTPAVLVAPKTGSPGRAAARFDGVGSWGAL